MLRINQHLGSYGINSVPQAFMKFEIVPEMCAKASNRKLGLKHSKPSPVT
jgi:hypothetical protein